MELLRRRTRPGKLPWCLGPTWTRQPHPTAAAPRSFRPRRQRLAAPVAAAAAAEAEAQGPRRPRRLRRPPRRRGRRRRGTSASPAARCWCAWRRSRTWHRGTPMTRAATRPRPVGCRRHPGRWQGNPRPGRSPRCHPPRARASQPPEGAQCLWFRSRHLCHIPLTARGAAPALRPAGRVQAGPVQAKGRAFAKVSHGPPRSRRRRRRPSHRPFRREEAPASQCRPPPRPSCSPWPLKQREARRARSRGRSRRRAPVSRPGAPAQASRSSSAPAASRARPLEVYQVRLVALGLRRRRCLQSRLRRCPQPQARSRGKLRRARLRWAGRR